MTRLQTRSNSQLERNSKSRPVAPNIAPSREQNASDSAKSMRKWSPAGRISISIEVFCLRTCVAVKGMVAIWAGIGERDKNCRETGEYTIQ